LVLLIYQLVPIQYTLKAYPNPTTDFINIEFDSELKDTYIGTLFTSYGQVMRSNLNFDLRSSNIVSFNMSDLSQGVFVLHITDEEGNKIWQVKLVKE